MRVLVGSGWWCSQAPDGEVNPNRKKVGDDEVRQVAFFQKWLESVRRAGGTEEIVVIDSCSPVKPSEEHRAGVRWVELPFNARHSTDHLGQWSGWMRSVLAGGSYALCAEAEYFVYVEQDCLLGGTGAIEHAISGMKTGLMFGSGQGTPQPIQQSFFIVRKDRLPGFLKNLSDLKDRDCELAPEWKFVFASWRPLVLLSNMGLMKSAKSRRIAQAITKRLFFEYLPLHGGRARPLRPEEGPFYFQHGTREELDWFFAQQQGG